MYTLLIDQRVGQSWNSDWDPQFLKVTATDQHVWWLYNSVVLQSKTVSVISLNSFCNRVLTGCSLCIVILISTQLIVSCNCGGRNYTILNLCYSRFSDNTVSIKLSGKWTIILALWFLYNMTLWNLNIGVMCLQTKGTLLFRLKSKKYKNGEHSWKCQNQQALIWSDYLFILLCCKLYVY